MSCNRFEHYVRTSCRLNNDSINLEEKILKKNSYDNPLDTRYASKEMQLLISSDTKFKT